VSFLRSFFPDAASSFAGKVDALYLFMLLVSGLVALGLFVAIGVFAVRYRAGSKADRSGASIGSWPLEITWSVLPMVIFIGFFVWGAHVFLTWHEPPPGAIHVYVVGKQWMWKIQHPEGRREINEMHVPVGTPVVVTMTSEDVIHDLFVPAFRVKKDVLPGRYSRIWFRATKVGRFHMFCSQYCGTDHASMGGWVYAMAPADYQNWLSGGTAGQTMAQAGETLFSRYNCITCHFKGGRGPLLQGVAGSTVRLQGDGTVTADEDYLRESILRPQAKVVAGFDPVMPTFQGQLKETDVLQLIAYIESLGGDRATQGPP